jgi:hypothetical protein
MVRFYGDYTQPIALDDFASADGLMEAAVSERQDLLVDLAAQTYLPLFKWIDECDLLDLAKQEAVGVTLWHVLDDGVDGIDLLGRLLDRYATRADYVVVKNLGRGKDFSAFEASAARAKAAAFGVPVIELPELHGATIRKVDQLSLSFWAAGHNRQAGLGLMERQRVKVWTRRAYEQFDALGESLFCRPASAPAVTETEVAEPVA